MWTILANNVSGSYKIGFAIALEVGVGNVGGIVSAWVFRGADSPVYVEGYKIITDMTCAAIVLLCLYTGTLWVENKARDAGKRDHRLIEADVDNLGDDHPHFRYGY